MKDSSFTSLSKLQGSMHKAVVGYFRTKDFIKAIRRCKSASEERALLAREAASIRNALKNPNITADHRYHSLGKLVVMHLLGHPVLFGQVECMKLAASVRKSTGRPRLNHKRLGYLGTSLLVDGEQCTLPLICNTIKSDLVSSDPPVMAMAANSLALFANSAEIGQEMLPQILDVLGNRTLHHEVRKRLAATAAQMVRSCPDLGELFVETKRGNRPVLAPCLDILMSDRNEGKLLALCELLLTLVSNEVVGEFVREECKGRILPNLLRALDTVRKAAPPEYDVAGVPDPFLQGKLIKLFARIAMNDPVASEVVAATLLDVMSTTSIAMGAVERHVSVALILECCKALLSLPCPPAAQEAASRQLVDLLANSAQLESTVRYVILRTVADLRQTSLSDLLTLHRGQLLNALKDSGLEWSLKSSIISLTLVNLTVNNYQLVLDNISQVLAEEKEATIGDKLEVVKQIIEVLERVPLKNATWLGNFMNGLLGPMDSSEYELWMIVSRVIDLIDRQFHSPWQISVDTRSNKYLQAISFWINGERLNCTALVEPPLGSDDYKLFGYYIGYVGKQGRRFPQVLDDALDRLRQVALRGPMASVERAVETATLLSTVASTDLALHSKRLNDHVMIYDEVAIQESKKEQTEVKYLFKVQRLENQQGHYELTLKKKDDGDLKVELESSKGMSVSLVKEAHWLLVKPVVPLPICLYERRGDGWLRRLLYIDELPLHKPDDKSKEKKLIETEKTDDKSKEKKSKETKESALDANSAIEVSVDTNASKQNVTEKLGKETMAEREDVNTKIEEPVEQPEEKVDQSEKQIEEESVE